MVLYDKYMGKLFEVELLHPGVRFFRADQLIPQQHPIFQDSGSG